MEVSLRPVRDEADLEAVLGEPDGHHSEFNQFGPASVMHLLTRFREHGLVEPHRGTLAVVADGHAVGHVDYRAVPFGPVPRTEAWEIGISLLVPARGRGIGRRAQRLLADHLFAHTPAQRVQASTDITNVAEQRALDGAGFTREGILRSAQWRLGTWHDLVLYSRLRSDAG